MSENVIQNSVIRQIFQDATVLQTIREAAFETPEQEWTVIDIHETVFDALGVDLDIDDTETFGTLLVLFNAMQTQCSLMH